MDWDDDIADERSASDAPMTMRKSDTAVEGGEALDLYARRIARNLNDLEEQVLLLRDACAERAKLLREIE